MSMKLEHSTKVTNDGKKIITNTWHTDSGKPTSQTIKSTDLKSGKVTVTNVSGGKLLP
jgi:predicted alpha-1,6-mannanase (GH76 family)